MATAADIGNKPIALLNVLMVTKHEGGARLLVARSPHGWTASPIGIAAGGAEGDSDSDEHQPKAKKSRPGQPCEAMLKDLP